MKHVVRFALLFTTLVSTFAVMVSAQESIADASRKAKSQKKPQATKVYTNDDIPSVVVPASEKSPATGDITGEKEPAKPADAKAEKSDKDKDEKSGENKAEQFKKAVADQKTKVADLERELNLMEREHQVRVAAYYADAGNQLRDSKKWFEDEKKYQDDLAARQKGLSDARDKLADLQESARKAGVPMGQIE